MNEIKLFVATKKGAFKVSSKDGRKTWQTSQPDFLGHIIYHMVPDPRESGTVLMAATTGHLGPTVFRSTDQGITWKEAKKPPAFPETQKDKRVKFVFWLTPGHISEPGVWYAGTSPQGLFKSYDGGVTWESFDKFNLNPDAQKWMECGGTPAGPLLHSINVNPHDKNHIYLALSLGGVFETTDGGEKWAPLNQGLLADFLPDPYPKFGQCVHNMQLSPVNPDILYQQGHSGVFRLDRRNGNWVRIGENLPKEIGDKGFPLVLHPRDENNLWLFPMDGSGVWPRTCVGGQPAVYRSTDGGQTWQRQDKGFPVENAWFTVKRQAMSHDDQTPLGIYLGTNQGEIWASFNEGKSWENIVQHLPAVLGIEVAVTPNES